MAIITDLFNTFFFQPIINLLVLIFKVLESVGLPGALGFAIILLTIIIRLLVWPFMAVQLKSAKKMADLKPKLDELKTKHGSDRQALAAAQMSLYKEHGVNPAGGCLPTLIQFPVLIALYQTILAFFEGNGGLEKINSNLYSTVLHLSNIPSPIFFGLNLADKPSPGPLLLVPIITAALTFLQSKMMTPSPVKQYPSDSPKEKKEKEGVGDSMSAVQSQMMYMMPVLIGFFAFQFPIGLALYWNVLTLVSIYQQHRISGWGGLDSWVKVIKR